MEKSFDIVVFGATGFTGRLAAQRLSERTGLRIAIAGRNRGKLEQIAAKCSRRPDILVADADDPNSIRKMVESTAVVANFAGPFVLHAEPVIAACVELGRNYCDISGETPFVREMIDRYDARARQHKATLIPMSGFDSVPADLLTFMALREAEQNSWNIDALTHYYQLHGGFNGGTLASALILAEQHKTHLLNDPNILIPDPAWERGPRFSQMPEQDPVLKRWSAPFLMHAVNAAVVRRSIYLGHPEDKEKGRITYRERQLLSSGWRGRAEAFALTGTLAAFGGLSEISLGRSLLRKIGPAPGEGPSESTRNAGFYRGRLIACEKGEPRLVVRMIAQGDPGNVLTVLFATETARMLVEGPTKSSGFTTVSRAFANPLIQRLESEGVQFTTQVLPEATA